jgi:hypothetical protein
MMLSFLSRFRSGEFIISPIIAPALITSRVAIVVVEQQRLNGDSIATAVESTLPAP